MGYISFEAQNNIWRILTMNQLFTPFKIKDLTLRNRVVMAPMCMYSADEQGFVQPFHKIHYETRAMGGVSLVILEATAVEARGRISANDLGIWSDAHIEGLSEVVKGIHKHGALAGIQLAHAGRKCGVLSEDVIAPSPLNFDDNDPSLKKPREMNSEDIVDVIYAFAEGARRAKEAGFDIIELHGAHGYLINEFLSPLTNHRQDAFGYAQAYGTRFLKDILASVKQTWPESSPIFLRISAEDYAEGGITPEKISAALTALNGLGIDLINVSSGGVVPARIHTFDGYQTKFAETVKSLTNYPVMAGGRIKTSVMADEIIRNGRADLVFLGRQLLIDPYFALHAADELKQEIDYTPKQYLRWTTSR